MVRSVLRRIAPCSVPMLLLASLALPPTAVAGPPRPPQRPDPELAGAGAAELVVVTPGSLARTLVPGASRAYLVEGTRPPGDRPDAGTKVLGRRTGDGDWLLVGTGHPAAAVWVTGLPAPPPREEVVLVGRVEADGEGGAVRSLSGVRFLVPGDGREEVAAPVGDYVLYTLPGGMAGRDPAIIARRLPIDSVRVEVDGDAAAEAFTDWGNVAVFRAVRPGVAKVRFLAYVSGEGAPRPMGGSTLRVVRPSNGR